MIRKLTCALALLLFLTAPVRGDDRAATLARSVAFDASIYASGVAYCGAGSAANAVAYLALVHARFPAAAADGIRAARSAFADAAKGDRKRACPAIVAETARHAATITEAYAVMRAAVPAAPETDKDDDEPLVGASSITAFFHAEKQQQTAWIKVAAGRLKRGGQEAASLEYFLEACLRGLASVPTKESVDVTRKMRSVSLDHYGALCTAPVTLLAARP